MRIRGSADYDLTAVGSPLGESLTYCGFFISARGRVDWRRLLGLRGNPLLDPTNFDLTLFAWSG